MNHQIGEAFGKLLDGEMETRKWAGRGNWGRPPPRGKVSATLTMPNFILHLEVTVVCLLTYRIGERRNFSSD